MWERWKETVKEIALIIALELFVTWLVFMEVAR